MSSKLYIYYNTNEERVAAWKKSREEYNEWRLLFGRKFVADRRKRQSNLCFICLRELDKLVHIDHIFPLFLGGTNSKLNLCITHPTCNIDKGAKATTNYKQACARRKLFNQIVYLEKVRKLRLKRPSLPVSKREQRALRNCDKHLTPQLKVKPKKIVIPHKNYKRKIKRNKKDKWAAAEGLARQQLAASNRLLR